MSSLRTNLLTPLPDASAGEVFTDLLARPGCRIERIVSQGQVTPPDQPYCQAHDEWVMVVAGRACLEMAGHAHWLGPADTLFIPAGVSHRVTFTELAEPTVWLAVHLGEAASSPATDAI